MTNFKRVNHILFGSTLILATLFKILSTFLWQNGEYGVYGSTWALVSDALWIPAYIALFGLLKAKMPYYANIGLFIAILGCVGGVTFGFEGLYTAALYLSNHYTLQAHDHFPTAFNVTLFWLGPLYPISLFILSIVLIWKKITPWWIGLMWTIAAIGFPISRIPPRIELFAHVVDILMFVPAIYITWKYFYRSQETLDSEIT
ncbi:hypothetical protein SAMN05444392_10549 [Seinonella peptonophila]|uniref:Uncharacterized protein n=1 Tax=Seinonella peptonophila TaxID=112248 RepID=A0A1M4XKF0_9BACL|nr:hypothetical protein [Seinonella peptonophila]SHE93979.1 hypothetical protein SAMN05444392_10549 [Seinonella peptonophila]